MLRFISGLAFPLANDDQCVFSRPWPSVIPPARRTVPGNPEFLPRHSGQGPACCAYPAGHRQCCSPSSPLRSRFRFGHRAPLLLKPPEILNSQSFSSSRIPVCRGRPGGGKVLPRTGFVRGAKSKNSRNVAGEAKLPVGYHHVRNLGNCRRQPPQNLQQHYTPTSWLDSTGGL